VGFVKSAQVAPSPTRDGAIGAFAGGTLGIAVALMLPRRRRAAPVEGRTTNELLTGLQPFADPHVTSAVGNGRGPTTGSTVLR
jgi:hypothetical protein